MNSHCALLCDTKEDDKIAEIYFTETIWASKLLLAKFISIRWVKWWWSGTLNLKYSSTNRYRRRQNGFLFGHHYARKYLYMCFSIYLLYQNVSIARGENPFADPKYESFLEIKEWDFQFSSRHFQQRMDFIIIIRDKFWWDLYGSDFPCVVLQKKKLNSYHVLFHSQTNYVNFSIKFHIKNYFCRFWITWKMKLSKIHHPLIK